LRQYLTGRSLWIDEAMLALNIVNRDIMGLFQPLDYDQGAPLGFLFAEKIFNLLFGRNEYALRLFPLLAGILGIWIFHLLLKRIVLNDAARFTALTLFVLNPRLVYYSSEVKQYILDVFVTIALFLVAAPLLENREHRNDFIYLAIVGFLALWLSHPAVFVLMAIGITLVILYVQRRDYRGLRYILGIGLLWAVTLAVLYLLILNDIQQNAYMKEYWQGAFLPMPPWSDLTWYTRVLNENIGLQFGIPYAVYLVFGLMLFGWFALWKNQRSYATIIAFTALFTLIASSLQLYPLLERMILFTIPIGLLLIGKSIEVLYETLPKRGSLNLLMTMIVAGYLVYGPLTTSLGYFIKPRYYEHMRPAMENLQASWKAGDTLFVSNGAVPAFEYYAPMYGLEGASYHSSERQDYEEPQKILEKLDALQGQRRVWILMSHVYENNGFNEKDVIIDYLKQHGTRKREFRMPGTSVYLYLFDMGG
jgi:4-amino-4-deoxy-L-arabinose transferase-like glycosyltransferase